MLEEQIKSIKGYEIQIEAWGYIGMIFIKYNRFKKKNIMVI
jgi:hypothetical protein